MKKNLEQLSKKAIIFDFERLKWTVQIIKIT